MAVPAREVTPQLTPEKTMAALHVVHLIEALGPGGAERLLYTNLKHFDASRVRSTVFTVYSHANHWLEPIREQGVPVMSLDCVGPRDLSLPLADYDTNRLSSSTSRQRDRALTPMTASPRSRSCSCVTATPQPCSIRSSIPNGRFRQ